MDRLKGKTILVVEDDFFIATDLCRSLAAEGGKVLGPVGRIEDALGLITQSDHIDAAFVDLNLHGVMAYAVADALTERSIPFLIVTGYDSAAIPERFKSIAHCQKPIALDKAFILLFG